MSQMKRIKEKVRRIFGRKPKPSQKSKKGFVTLHKLDHWGAYYARQFINKALAYSEATDSLSRLHRFRSARESIFTDAIPADFLDIALICYVIRLSGSRRVLELGSGCSTVAILNTLMPRKAEERPAGFSPNFLSVESEEKWADVNRQEIRNIWEHDSLTLPEWFELRYCPASVIEIGAGEEKVRSYSHDFAVTEPFDFIYVDGPHLVDAPHSCDILKPGIFNEQTIVCVDGRAHTVRLIRKAMEGWTVLEPPYPSNDTYFIHPRHKAYTVLAEVFGLKDGCGSNV